jgi:hypothetical protein
MRRAWVFCNSGVQWICAEFGVQRRLPNIVAPSLVLLIRFPDLGADRNRNNRWRDTQSGVQSASHSLMQLNVTASPFLQLEVNVVGKTVRQ